MGSDKVTQVSALGWIGSNEIGRLVIKNLIVGIPGSFKYLQEIRSVCCRDLSLWSTGACIQVALALSITFLELIVYLQVLGKDL